MVSSAQSCDTPRMENAAAELPIGHHWFVDDQGVALRTTWRLGHGFVNLSLWEHDRCTSTFHLTPAAAAELMSFLARGLADATTVATTASVHALPDPPLAATEAQPTVADQLAAGARSARSGLARRLEAIAARVTPD